MSLSPLFCICALLLLCILGLGIKVPIAQDQLYHDFADKGAYWGIPYFWNVVSNLPMFFIGAYGLYQHFRNKHLRSSWAARWIPFVLSLGIFATSFGSAYYHYAPDNRTLLWDRLPMTLMFMSLFSLLMYDFIGKKVGSVTFTMAIPLGISSVLYWHFTEAAGHGDLRPYTLVQFFPMLAAMVLILFFPKKVPYIRHFLMIIGVYALAKLCEHFDRQIFDLLGFWSGHTLKHLIGAVSLVYAMKLVDTWYPEG